MMETSYSISSVASCPHCFRMLIASASVLPWRRIPSMLNNRSPGLIVPSLEGEREGVYMEALEGQKDRWRRSQVTHRSAGPPGLMFVMTMGRDLFLSSWAPPAHTHARVSRSELSVSHTHTNVSPLLTKPKLFPSLCSVTSTFLNMTPDPCTAATKHDSSTTRRSKTRGTTDGPCPDYPPPPAVLTQRRQLVLHLQDHTLSDVLQQADDFVMPELRQVDSVHGADVVAHVQLVAPVKPVHFHHLAFMVDQPVWSAINWGILRNNGSVALPGSDASLPQVWNPRLPVLVDASRHRQSQRRAFLLHQLHHRTAPELV